jgi:hypothetical protein
MHICLVPLLLGLAETCRPRNPSDAEELEVKLFAACTVCSCTTLIAGPFLVAYLGDKVPSTHAQNALLVSYVAIVLSPWAYQMWRAYNQTSLNYDNQRIETRRSGYLARLISRVRERSRFSQDLTNKLLPEAFEVDKPGENGDNTDRV